MKNRMEEVIETFNYEGLLELLKNNMVRNLC